MDFELSDDQVALPENARAVLAAACPPSVVRSVFEHRGDGREVWQQLTQLGWPALGIGAAHGGLDRDFVDVALVVEELGRVVAPSPYVATATQFVPLLREAGSPAHHDRFLPRVAVGTLTGTVALAEDGVWQTGAVRATARRAGQAWVVNGHKSHVLDGATADEIVVVARHDGSSGDDGLGVFVVPSEAVMARPATVIDPTMPLAELELDDVEVAEERVLREPGDPSAVRAVQRALDESTTAMVLSLTATCRAIFETTLQYAKDRVQFGRPIGSFQALKHRLADMLVAVERATSVCWFAALAIAEDDDRRTVNASMAKAAASDCQRLLAKDGLQLHGGIGFTWEYDLHFLLKRAKSADALFGSGASHRAALAPMLGLPA